MSVAGFDEVELFETSVEVGANVIPGVGGREVDVSVSPGVS